MTLLSCTKAQIEAAADLRRAVAFCTTGRRAWHIGPNMRTSGVGGRSYRRFPAAATLPGTAATAQLIEPIALGPYCTKPAAVGAECAAVIGK
jgi:hypothetical protein